MFAGRHGSFNNIQIQLLPHAASRSGTATLPPRSQPSNVRRRFGDSPPCFMLCSMNIIPFLIRVITVWGTDLPVSLRACNLNLGPSTTHSEVGGLIRTWIRTHDFRILVSSSTTASNRTCHCHRSGMPSDRIGKWGLWGALRLWRSPKPVRSRIIVR